MKTLATQFQLLKENKGNKDVFLKTAKTKYPSYVPQSATFNEAVNILKQKGIINENIIDLMPINTNVVKKESFELAFSSFLKEAKKKDTVENTIDKTDKKNPDNLIFDQIMAGCYVEAKNVKNKDKSIDEIKDIVVKNLSKDPIYYTKNAAFKVDGLGYKDDAPGLGIPKEAKGKYKSSGYGDIDKKFLNENKGWDSKNDTPEIKKLMSIADDTSNSPSKRDMARQKAYKLRQQIKINEIVNENKIETIDSYIKSEKNPKIKNTLIKIRGKFLHKDKLTDVETKLINKLIPHLKESETRSVGPMTKPTESTFKVGDMVINNGIKHRVTRIEGDKIYIKKIMPSNRPEIPVKAQDLKKAKTNESNTNDTGDLFDMLGIKQDIIDMFEKGYAPEDIIDQIFNGNDRYLRAVMALGDSLNNYEKFVSPVNEYEEDEETYEFNVGEDSHYGKVKSRKMVGNKLHVTFDTNKTYEFEKFMGKWVENKQINESYGSNSDFDGTGLVVVGRTQLDNNEIADMVDDGDYYGVWNAREGYWFFKEDEETLDALETELEAQFASRGINARFEAQFDEDGIDYDDENFSDPLIDGEEDLFEYEKNMSENILTAKNYKDFYLFESENEKPTESQLSKMKDKLESYVDKVGNYEEAVAKYLKMYPNDKKYKNTLLSLAEPLFESENKKPTESQLSKMKDKLESYVDKANNTTEAVSMYLKRFPQDKKYKNILMTLAEPLF